MISAFWVHLRHGLPHSAMCSLFCRWWWCLCILGGSIWLFWTILALDSIFGAIFILSLGFEFWCHSSYFEQRVRVFASFWAQGSSFGAILHNCGHRVRVFVQFWSNGSYLGVPQGRLFSSHLSKGFEFVCNSDQMVRILGVPQDRLFSVHLSKGFVLWALQGMLGELNETPPGLLF